MTVQEALIQNTNELKLKIEEHRKLLIQLGDVETKHDDSVQCPLFSCPHESKLRTTMYDTISVLDETRKSFRSKQLEVLRKKLIKVLAETTG